MAEQNGWRRHVIRNLRRAATATTQLVSGFTGDDKTTGLDRSIRELTTTQPKVAVVYVD